MKLQIIDPEGEMKLCYSSHQKGRKYLLKVSKLFTCQCSLLDFHLQSNVELKADHIKRSSEARQLKAFSARNENKN